jgi:phospholipid transport system transporter-binding protein
VTENYNLSAAGENNFKVSGVVSFETASQLREAGTRLLDRYSELCFDFVNVTRADSSAIALLLSWIRYANKKHKQILFINLPRQLWDIATVSGVSALLNNNIRW